MGLVKQLFSFQGRISRGQYWLCTLLLSGVNVFSFILATVMNAGQPLVGKGDVGAALGAVLLSAAITIPLNLAVIWGSLAVQVKRFHDRGRSGWLAAIPFALIAWMLTSLIGAVIAKTPPMQALGDLGLPFAMLMFVSLAFFIDLGLLPSKEGPNKYGNPPGAPGGGATYTPPRPQPNAPAGQAAKPAAAAVGSLMSAEAAIERAIAERPAARVAPRTPATPAPRAPMTPATATPLGGGGGSFGRRAR